MAIVRGTGVSGSSTGSTTVSASVTIPATNAYLVVLVAGNNNPGVTTSGVTCGGVSMTKIGNEFTNVVNSDSRTINASLWELVAPASGVKSVVATMSGTTNGSVIYCQPYTGVIQASPHDGTVSQGSGSSTSVTGTITTAALGSWALMFAVAPDGGTSASTNATLVGSAGQAKLYDTMGLAAGYISPPGSFSMSATDANTGPDQMAFVMIGIQAIPYIVAAVDTDFSSDSVVEGFMEQVSDATTSTDVVIEKFGWGNDKKNATTWQTQPKTQP